ncbi:MAG TPA: hypothetical protein DDW51_05690 [Cyanobacteria bacterium UBA11367]|nr:hypothetical protein [Cyanobacteria bacterium UBA11367]HBE56775.1 hypothetical protein [Cyanobacteria bacterium UBA11366]HBK83568.1 hypothetical protein [Flavobacterium sp.]HCA95980.1 hypothetical protein [Cyanobacteria bacterium UBA9226]
MKIEEIKPWTKVRYANPNYGEGIVNGIIESYFNDYTGEWTEPYLSVTFETNNGYKCKNLWLSQAEVDEFLEIVQ